MAGKAKRNGKRNGNRRGNANANAQAQAPRDYRSDAEKALEAHARGLAEAANIDDWEAMRKHGPLLLKAMLDISVEIVDIRENVNESIRAAIKAGKWDTLGVASRTGLVELANDWDGDSRSQAGGPARALLWNVREHEPNAAADLGLAAAVLHLGRKLEALQPAWRLVFAEGPEFPDRKGWLREGWLWADRESMEAVVSPHPDEAYNASPREVDAVIVEYDKLKLSVLDRLDSHVYDAVLEAELGRRGLNPDGWVVSWCHSIGGFSGDPADSFDGMAVSKAEHLLSELGRNPRAHVLGWLDVRLWADMLTLIRLGQRVFELR